VGAAFPGGKYTGDVGLEMKQVKEKTHNSSLNFFRSINTHVQTTKNDQNDLIENTRVNGGGASTGRRDQERT